MKRFLALACVGIALCIAYFLNFFGPAYTVPLGAPVRHDDFTFTVTAVSRTSLPGGQLTYTVHVAVANQAKRVPYHWNDRIAYVREGRGPRYYAVTRQDVTIAAGDIANLTLKFVVPESVTHPALRYWDGVFMGDAFNGAAYAKAAVRLY